MGGSKLTELIDQVKAAKGPSMGLDDDIRSVLNDGYQNGRLSPYTASIDAALALTERVLPGAEMHITLNHPKNDWQTASIRVAPLKLVSGEEATLPLAIIAATLSALIALEAQE